MPNSLPNLGQWDDTNNWNDAQLWVDVPNRGSWKGNSNNPAPNNNQEPISRSEKVIGDNRSNVVRRDNDTQKDFTISLMDIDEAIMLQLKQLQIQVTDAGKQIEVPIFYGSPEKWVSAQRDGYIRDQQGKLILPAIVIKRTDTADDDTLRFFNRYSNASVMKLYSEKNKYTKFASLVGKNVPVNEVYNVVIPSHVILTYHCIIWTELVEQMNPIVEKIRFNTNDYWGSSKGLRFRVRVESYAHTTELQTDQDRMVKTEFDLIVHGYILPDTMTKLEKHQKTTNKFFTPKKLIMGMEVVGTDYNMLQLDKNREKWRNKKYPNLPEDVPIPSVPNVAEDTIKIYTKIVQVFNSSSTTAPTFHLPPPNTSSDPGEDGWTSYDSNYYYIYTEGQWKRVPIALFNANTSF